jgi:hypothetical protein
MNHRPFMPAGSFKLKRLANDACTSLNSGSQRWIALSAKDSNMDGRFAIKRVA